MSSSRRRVDGWIALHTPTDFRLGFSIVSPFPSATLRASLLFSARGGPKPPHMWWPSLWAYAPRLRRCRCTIPLPRLRTNRTPAQCALHRGTGARSSSQARRSGLVGFPALQLDAACLASNKISPRKREDWWLLRPIWLASSRIPGTKSSVGSRVSGLVGPPSHHSVLWEGIGG